MITISDETYKMVVEDYGKNQSIIRELMDRINKLNREKAEIEREYAKVLKTSLEINLKNMNYFNENIRLRDDLKTVLSRSNN